MSLLKLALLLAVSVSLEFSNPMMPGAGGLGTEDSVKGRQSDRGRDADAGAPRLPAAAPHRIVPGPPSSALRARPAPAGEPTWRVHVRRSYPSSSRSFASSEEG
jgi:hypothetical protein